MEEMMTSPETSTDESWKLYENPFYNSHLHHQNQPENQQQQCQSNSISISNKQQQQQHCLHLPISARKLAASFWDLTFFKPAMESEIDHTRTQIDELKAEIEYERKARKKLESLNKRLAKELGEERRAREAIERGCEELAREITFGKSEISRMKKEMEEERKMLRMAEVLREERVQMKFAEAKLLFEEKLLELEGCKQMQSTLIKEVKVSSFFGNSASKENNSGIDYSKNSIGGDLNDTTTTRSVVLGEKAAFSDNSGGFSSMAIQRRASPEPENPHIKRGIKGFVEFPRVVRAVGSKNRHWGTKLECQKAQLRILMKQKSPIRSNSFIVT